MIPVSLTLNGIYSYQSQQTIDFTSLTKNHLFGIFGLVGSGKSTILEAISFALYGETERLNPRDGRNYNMMNLKSDSIFIDFTFKAGQKNSELFRFTVKGNRDKKDFSLVKALDRKAYKCENDNWIPIDANSASSIIGLSYDNFRRTIIIPQGKFQEFLQLNESDRTRMMKEIFNLERYDLARKTDFLDRQNTNLLEGIKGQLQGIGIVSQSMIDETNLRKDDLKKIRIKKAKELDESRLAEKKFEDMRSLSIKLDKQREELKELENLESHYKMKHSLVEQYEVCYSNFPDLLNQYEDLNNQIEENSNELSLNDTSLTKTNDNLILTEKKFNLLKPEYEKRHMLESKWIELDKLNSILLINKGIASLEAKRSNYEERIAEYKEIIEKEKNELKKCESELKKSKKEMPNEKVLLEIKKWYEKNDTLNESINELQVALNDEASELKALEVDKSNLLAASYLSSIITVKERKLPLGELIEIFQNSIKKNKSLKNQIQSEIDLLRKNETLETFAHNLKEGIPCPLCGSEHHPQSYVGKGVRKKVDSLQKEIRKIDKSIEEVEEIIHNSVKLNSEMQSTIKSNEKALKELAKKKESWKLHQAIFSWSGYNPKSSKKVDSELKLSESKRERIEDLEEQREDSQQSIDETNESLIEIQKEFQLLNKELSEDNGKIKILYDQLKHYSPDSISQWTEKSIKIEIDKLKQTYNILEKQFKESDELLRSLKETQSNLKGKIKANEDSHKKYMQNLSKLEKEITKRLTITGMKDIEAVSEILNTELDIISEKASIKKYYENLSSAKKQLEILNSEISENTYDEVLHQEVKLLIEKLDIEMSGTDKEIGQLEKQVTDLVINLRKKEELERKREDYETKASNLKLLKTLFRGGGFVNYASRIYLENLCGIANNRFTKLTRQRLRLELKDDNSFQIRDYLNDGKVRSVKTLSGGQTFQASLSMALGLADNLQQYADTNESFFFLDEGFGTLDKESLQVVFEALKSLRQENRIVGVISHVEELQQEIDNYVKVELDQNIGSVITHN